MWNARPSSARWPSGLSGKPLPWRSLVALLLALLALIGCGPKGPFPVHRESLPTIAVGGTQSAEQLALCELTAQALEKSGYAVVRRFTFSDASAVRRALLVGNVDLCWDYTGDIWTTYLGHDIPIADPDKMYLKVREEDALNQVIWLAPTPVRRTLGMLVTNATARDHGIYAISDLARSVRSERPKTSLCAPRDLFLRPTGMRGLQRVYGFRFDEASVVDVPLEEGYRRLSRGECDCALGYPNEAAQVVDGLRALRDDQGYFMVSSLVTGVRAPVLQQAPDLEIVMRSVSELLTRENLAELSRAVEAKGKPAPAAKRFLKRGDWVVPDQIVQPTPTSSIKKTGE